MTGSRLRPAFLVGLFLGLLVVALQGVQSEELEGVPPEDLCRPYIEKALKDLGTGSLEQISAEIGTGDGESQQEGALPGSEEQADEPSGGSTEEGSQEVTETDASAEKEGEGSTEETAEEEAVASDEQADEQADKVSGEEEQADASTGESAEVIQADEEEKSTEIEEEKESSAEATIDSGEDKVVEEDTEQKSAEETEAESGETAGTEEAGAEKSDEQTEEAEQKDEESPSDEVKSEEKDDTAEDDGVSEGDVEDTETDEGGESKGDETENDSTTEADDAVDESHAEDEAESAAASDEETVIDEDDSKAQEEASKEEAEVSKEGDDTSKEEEVSQVEEGEASTEASVEDVRAEQEDRTEEEASKEEADVSTDAEEGDDQGKAEGASHEDAEPVPEEGESEESSKDEDAADEATDDKAESAEEVTDDKAESAEEATDEKAESAEEAADEKAESAEEAKDEKAESAEEAVEDVAKSRGRREVGEAPTEEATESTEVEEESGAETGASEEQEPTPEEDLIEEIVVPEHLRPREHIDQLLKLDEENEEKERAIQKMADIILRDLKRLYDNAIQPLETLYKYRDLSNRHFGDPEIFSKPLVLFMGPWSGGKSSIINYLLDIEYKQTSLRTGAEPSPAYFNIIMHGEEEEILDGTQLAADWTFSGLQKFGQGLLDRLRGLKLNNKLLEKVNIVEIPGILEVRKQVQRVFPFNDACQWFIDRADIIFLVYDPSKLDVGPETEAILDQLKGREYQTRIILNKADQVKPEELMRVQGALIWNISPLMSSAEPPIMYSTSLWSLPYEAGAPTRLLYAQERAFLRDLRSAIDKRVEHKIASARRFAVRVRNHAKMVDCYLTTYYNHKTFFGNKKEISDKIIENPQDYHIYEGLSTLTNISRYDLPDPDVYRDFFRLNALYDFQQLSATCTYFRGCPINRLDVAIAYDLPELVGKYKKSVEAVIHESEANSPLS